MKSRIVTVILLALLCGSTVAWAQERGEGRGGRGGRGGFGGRGMGMGGINELGLLNLEPVQKELELVDNQIAQIRTLTESQRGPGRGGRGGGPGGNRANFQDMTDEERQQFFEQRRQEAAENALKAKAELKNILLDDQLARLQQIFVQVAGTQALNDADVAAKLGLSDDQKSKIEATRQESQDEIREQSRDLFESGDREAAMAKMNELRQAADAKVLAHLTAEQQEQFAAMKGEAFDLPPGALFGGGRGGFGGPGGPGGPGGRRGGDRGDRPDRPQRPE